MSVLLRLQKRVKPWSQIAEEVKPWSQIAKEGETLEPNCSKRFKAALHPVVELFPDIFAELRPGLPLIRGVGMSINTNDSSPVSKPMYRLFPQEKAEVERQLADLVGQGSVRPSHSAWVSPLCSSVRGRCVGRSLSHALISRGSIATALPMQLIPSVTTLP